MSIKTRFIGCLHLGHLNLAKYRGFQDEHYYHERLIQNWNSVVKSKDIVYILGDVTFEKKEPYHLLNLLNGIKHVVLGNHDKKNHVRDLLNYVDTVSGMIDYKDYALTHCPIHPSELYFYKGNIHAHIHHINKLHDCVVPDEYGKYSKELHSTNNKYFNVDAYLVDYKPITIEELENNERII